VDVAILGLGLIGGSIARALTNRDDHGRVTAWTPSGRGPSSAVGHGIVAARTVAEAVSGADLVILAAPPLACLELLDGLATAAGDALAPSTVVTDVASTKVAIIEHAASLGLRFVGGHPMAGREASGWSASDAGLFRDRPWVIVPPKPDDTEAVGRVEELAEACGARPVCLAADVHDRAVAAISHVPLVVSAALIEAMTQSPDWPVAHDLAAGGWASMTRLARGEPTMGAGIVATNRAAVAEGVRAMRDALDAWLAVVAEPGSDEQLVEAIARRFRDARDRAG